jgi:exopolyphosphatase/guanosine-5'-triphosphate,3'-diphosphate pyrophosphatase
LKSGILVNKKLGIIKLGSNYVTLDVYEIKSQNSYKLIDANKHSVKLIENMVEGKYINDFSMHKSLKSIKLFKKLCLSYKIQPQNIITIISSSVKEAKNYFQLIELIEKSTNLNFSTLKENTEVHYIHLGVKYSMESNNCLIINISGGNTTIIYSFNKSIKNSLIIPIGYITAYERYLKENDLKTLKKIILNYLNDNNWLNMTSNCKLIGVGSFIKSLSKNIIQNENYPLNQIHNFEIKTTYVNNYFKDIFLDKIDNIPYNKKEMFKGGIFILKTLTEFFKKEQLLVSSCGYKEGILFNYLFNSCNLKYTDAINFSVNNLRKNFNYNNINSKNIVDLSLSLFSQLKLMHNFGLAEEKLLLYSAKLHEIGSIMGYHEQCNHTFYMISNANLYGFTHREIILLSSIAASYKNDIHNNKYLTKFKTVLSKKDIIIFKTLTLILKLATRLDKSKIRIIEALDCKILDTSVKIKTIRNGDAELEISLANELSEEFFELFNKKLIVT